MCSFTAHCSSGTANCFLLCNWDCCVSPVPAFRYRRGFQNAENGSCCPHRFGITLEGCLICAPQRPLIFKERDALFVQAVGNRFRGISLSIRWNISCHACRKLINNEMVLILRVFQVAKHSEGCDKLPFLRYVLMAPYLDGKISRQ